MKSIGLIGCGKMGQAILKGLGDGTVIVSRRNQAELKRICEESNAKAGTNAEAAACDIVFLCVKPQQYAHVLPEIAPYVRKDALFIYLAPGFTVETMRSKLNLAQDANIVHLMPNTPCAVGAGVLAYAAPASFTGDEEAAFGKLLSPLGALFRVEEKDMNAVVGVSGSSPAYFYMMIDALAMAGVRAGLSRQAAQNMAAQTMKGCAEMLLRSGKHPGMLRDEVMSPGGTTAEAVYVLEKEGFAGTLMEAVDRCVKKSAGMG